jgi:tRNA-uridine 2-sulfurtransferase
VKKDKLKIFVGISGGVDSSVAAYLLKKEGYDVHGVFVKTWSPEWLPCTWIDEKRDAMRVCASLGIPFHFLDAEEQYKEGVAEYMISEYKASRTPNPDVLCNRVIKFGVMWQYAASHGADCLATGHYARCDGVHLLKGIDHAKDQSYFLWMLDKEELKHVQFPIGHMQKSEVRAIAKKANLFTATKKDSQGICFLGEVDMKEFLKHYIAETKGDVVNEDGVVVGSHDGVAFYTLGERHGFTITEQSTERTPYYVTGKDIEKNVLYVSHSIRQVDENREDVTVVLRDVNWLVDIDVYTAYEAQIRYHGELHEAVVLDPYTVRMKNVTPLPLGQSLVLYKGEMVAGGGVIDEIR